MLDFGLNLKNTKEESKPAEQGKPSEPAHPATSTTPAAAQSGGNAFLRFLS